MQVVGVILVHNTNCCCVDHMKKTYKLYNDGVDAVSCTPNG